MLLPPPGYKPENKVFRRGVSDFWYTCKLLQLSPENSFHGHSAREWQSSCLYGGGSSLCAGMSLWAALDLNLRCWCNCLDRCRLDIPSCMLRQAMVRLDSRTSMGELVIVFSIPWPRSHSWKRRVRCAALVVHLPWIQRIAPDELLPMNGRSLLTSFPQQTRSIWGLRQ